MTTSIRALNAIQCNEINIIMVLLGLITALTAMTLIITYDNCFAEGHNFAIMLSVVMERRNDECRFAECRSAKMIVYCKRFFLVL